MRPQSRDSSDRGDRQPPSTELFSGQLDVIYDGDCAFCTRSVNLLRKVDIHHHLTFRRSQDWLTVQNLLPNLAPNDFASALYTRDSKGRQFRGFFGIRRVLWTSPYTRPLLPLFYMPGASFVGPLIYGWIAGHRHDFGCSSTGCTIPPLRGQPPTGR